MPAVLCSYSASVSANGNRGDIQYGRSSAGEVLPVTEAPLFKISTPDALYSSRRNVMVRVAASIRVTCHTCRIGIGLIIILQDLL